MKNSLNFPFRAAFLNAIALAALLGIAAAVALPHAAAGATIYDFTPAAGSPAASGEIVVDGSVVINGHFTLPGPLAVGVPTSGLTWDPTQLFMTGLVPIPGILGGGHVDFSQSSDPLNGQAWDGPGSLAGAGSWTLATGVPDAATPSILLLSLSLVALGSLRHFKPVSA